MIKPMQYNLLGIVPKGVWRVFKTFIITKKRMITRKQYGYALISYKWNSINDFIEDIVYSVIVPHEYFLFLL